MDIRFGYVVLVFIVCLHKGNSFSFVSEVSIDGNDTFELGSNATLICENSATPINVRLAINETTVVECIRDSCTVTAMIPRNYTISHNYSFGIILLYIENMSREDTVYQFMCDSHPYTHVIQLKIRDAAVCSDGQEVCQFPDGSSTCISRESECVGGTPLACDEKICLPCWIFTVILLIITAITVVTIVSVNVCCKAEYQGRWIHFDRFVTIGSVILIAAHVAVTLIARFCTRTGSCDDDKCLPCWAYCAILLVVISTSVFIIVLGRVCYGGKMCVRLHIWEVLAIAVNFLATMTYVAVIVLARFCRVKAYLPGTNNINCFIYGIILACFLTFQALAVLVVKGCCSKKGVVKALEVIFISGFIVLIVVEVVFVIDSGYRRKYTDNINIAVSCWSIFLIVSGATFVSFLLVTLICIFLEPIQEAKILSLKVDGKLMHAQLQWKCRLMQHKKLFVQLDLNCNQNNATELSYAVVDKNSCLMQGTIAGLTLDSQYRAHVYTKMYNIPSLEKTVEFDTKGRPLAPTNIREDEVLKTESSITLIWKAATKDADQQYLIKYKRQKAVNADWILTKEIDKTQFTLEKLKPGTTYIIILIAKNHIGLSEESKPIVAKTRAKIPEPPTNFHCKSVSKEEITVSWNPYRKISKQKFQLSVSNLVNAEESSTRSEDVFWIAYDGSKTMEYTVKELESGTEYVFEIVTVVGKMSSKRSAILFITTEGS